MTGTGVAGDAIKVRTRGGARVSRLLLDAASSTDDELRDAVRTTANGAVRIYRAQAPKRTGRLARSITAQLAGSSATVKATAVNPQSGFGYARVTRFGHRVARIYPVRARALAIPVPGGVIFRASVRGYKPATDWAAGVLPFVAIMARSRLRVAGRRLLS